MKYTVNFKNFYKRTVAPRVGAWIEIKTQYTYTLLHHVAPRVGAWIEIFVWRVEVALPKVAPRVGAWIEMLSKTPHTTISIRRSPCGGVD